MISLLPLPRKTLFEGIGNQCNLRLTFYVALFNNLNCILVALCPYEKRF